MRKEQVAVTKYIDKYIADDGAEFNNEEQCKEYERTQMSVVDANFNRGIIKRAFGDNFHFHPYYDDNLDIYYIKDKPALDYLNQYLAKVDYRRRVVEGVWTEKELVEFYGPKADEHRDRLGEPYYAYKFIPYEESYIGEKVVIWGSCGDVYMILTKGELFKLFVENLEELFKEDK